MSQKGQNAGARLVYWPRPGHTAVCVFNTAARCHKNTDGVAADYTARRRRRCWRRCLAPAFPSGPGRPISAVPTVERAPTAPQALGYARHFTHRCPLGADADGRLWRAFLCAAATCAAEVFCLGSTAMPIIASPQARPQSSGGPSFPVGQVFSIKTQGTINTKHI